MSGGVGAPLPDAAWAITQLVPSPEIAVGGEERGAQVGLRWQVTPVLYSFGVNRRKSPWRAFIAEPMVRQGGSVEAYVSPDAGGGLVVTPVPVDHVGFRYGIDAAWMTKRFTGWVFSYHGLTVYFGGDTAYDAEAFRATRRRFPHIDVALLPIGPVEPRELMKRVHMDGHEAVQAFLDLGARTMVPIHYDTFVNSSDPVGYAQKVLRAAMAQHGLWEDRVRVLAIGQEETLVAR